MSFTVIVLGADAATASLVGTGATIEQRQVKIDKGEEHLTTYEMPPRIRRQFCSTCGCSLFYFDSEFPNIMFYYPSTLDDGVHPGHSEERDYHVYVGSKADWEFFEDGLPRHDEGIEISMLSKNL